MAASCGTAVNATAAPPVPQWQMVELEFASERTYQNAYTEDRQAKGFNAALVMSVMPDRSMEGPRDRTQHAGFARGFEDLPDGHINEKLKNGTLTASLPVCTTARTPMLRPTGIRSGSISNGSKPGTTASIGRTALPRTGI